MDVSLTYLISDLRLVLGDTNSAAYRYTDEWLLVALQASIKALGRWWKDRYLINDSGNAYRNTTFVFTYAEPPVIQRTDERPIVLMAAYIILEGSLENSAWNFVSWRDNEISFSNLESSRARNNSLQRLWDELTTTLTPPSKRLVGANKQSLPGYKTNPYENKDPLL